MKKALPIVKALLIFFAIIIVLLLIGAYFFMGEINPVPIQQVPK